MSTPSFTGIPLELRERIYSNLLTYIPAPDSAPAPASPICALLTLNHQIHVEITRFLESQLFVLLKTNDAEFIKHTLDTKWGPSVMPLVSQLRSRDGTVAKSPGNAPIAMELEFYMYMSDREADSYAAFLVPASSLNTMVDAQGSPSFCIWTMQSLLSVKLLNIFSFTNLETKKILLRPYIDGFLRPVFVGIKTEGVDPEMTDLLREKLKGKYEAGGHLQKLQSLQHGAMRGEEDNWAQAAGRFRMARRYAEMVWENHQNCLSDPSTPFDGIHHLWMMHSSICANFVQVLLNIATGIPTPNIPTGDPNNVNEAFALARKAAEDAIRYLAPLPEWSRPETAVVEQALTALRKSKAKISFRAHAACKGVGDVDAAVGYLREAMRYEPETKEKLLQRIEGLKQEGARDGESVEGIARWE